MNNEQKLIQSTLIYNPFPAGTASIKVHELPTQEEIKGPKCNDYPN